MTWRTGHGAAKGKGPRIETLPPDETLTGIPVPRPKEQPGDRAPDGPFLPGNSLAAIGGHAKLGSTEIATSMTSKNAPEPIDGIKDYLKKGENFRRAHCRELAYTVGGGRCGPAPSAVVAMAARKMAWHWYHGDMANATGEAALHMMAARFAESARQDLQAAHELCTREALARSKVDAISPHEALEEALKEKKK